MNHSLTNYRARRIAAYDGAALLCDVIEALGDDDGKHLPIPDHEMPTAPSATVKRELQNQVRTLLRLILAHNDANLSHQEIVTW